MCCKRNIKDRMKFNPYRAVILFLALRMFLWWITSRIIILSLHHFSSWFNSFNSIPFHHVQMNVWSKFSQRPLTSRFVIKVLLTLKWLQKIFAKFSLVLFEKILTSAFLAFWNAHEWTLKVSNLFSWKPR